MQKREKRRRLKSGEPPEVQTRNGKGRNGTANAGREGQGIQKNEGEKATDSSQEVVMTKGKPNLESASQERSGRLLTHKKGDGPESSPAMENFLCYA